MSEPALKLDRVTKTFRGVTAVDELSFAVRPGIIFGLLGPNGSGKTTTLRMSLGILLPDSGQVRLWGEPPGMVVRARAGYLPEDRGLYPKMRVLDHLEFLGELHGVPRPLGRERARAWLARYDAGAWERRRVEELSKGQQQTVQLIGALVHDPDLVILDEPFTGLDPINTEHLQTTIRGLRDEGKAILLSTHRMDQVEQLCDEICLISHGRALLGGPLRQVKASYGRNVVELVMEGPNDGRAADDFLAALGDLVATAERQADGLRMRLRSGADSQEVLRRALAHGPVRRFEVTEPSLDEIFVEAVTRR